MNASQIISEIKDPVKGFTSLYVAKPREHVAALVSLGRIFPTTAAQAKRVTHLEELYNTDVAELVEPLLNKHGFKGEYKLTKSGRFCRLVNFSDFKAALRAEYGI